MSACRSSTGWPRSAWISSLGWRDEAEAMSHIGIWERYDWLRTAFLEEAGRRVGEQRAGMLYHALDTVFSASFREHKPQFARDLDATAYTISFNETIRSLNGWLIRKLLSRVDELERLNSPETD